MSQKQSSTFCIVVDCSIAQAAGSIDSKHPVGTRCRLFLESLRNNNHRLAWSALIDKEWAEHRSTFASTWLVAMIKRDKLHRIQSSLQLSEAIDETELDQGVKDALIKDSHLVEVALETDKRIASLDDKARNHFSNLSQMIQAIGDILWTNPVHEDEDATKWLEDGAPDQSKRHLKNYLRH